MIELIDRTLQRYVRSSSRDLNIEKSRYGHFYLDQSRKLCRFCSATLMVLWKTSSTCPSLTSNCWIRRARPDRMFLLPSPVPWGHRENLKSLLMTLCSRNTDTSCRPYIWKSSGNSSACINTGIYWESSYMWNRCYKMNRQRLDCHRVKIKCFTTWNPIRLMT